MGINTPTQRAFTHLNTTIGNPIAIRTALALIASLVTTICPALADTALVPLGATWKYRDDGSNQGTAWRTSAFNDSTWASGPAELGYGDGDEATVVNGGSPSNHFITTYFRKSFNVTNPSAFNSLKIRLLRDDGAVVYVNGTEVRRDNMPTGTVSSNTLASSALGAPAESTFFETSIGTSALVAGTNVIAVEVHQANATSTDVSFNLELTGVDTTSVTRGPYLQKGTPSSVIVRWRTNSPTNSRVSFGISPVALTSNADDSTLTTEHEIQLSGLTPDTQYYYSVGTSTAALASGSDYSFFTSPPTGTVQSTRIWVLGDSGTKDAVAAGVRDGYTSFTGTRNTDLWLMLGDNAYENGTDQEYQAAVFDMYPTYLRQTVLWSTIGNHDTAQSTNPSLNIPHFQIFNLPTAGEAGGVASGTEKYYSFDYANIHFICLDSMTSSRQPGSPMLTWLQSDLESTTQQWLVAFWHHPAYTKGSHNSDTETPLIEMRQNVLPILEAGGVDLVLAGHSHNYERSFFINGHYGLSNSFSGQHLVDGGDGRETGNGVYSKPGGLPANQGAVYITAGNGGHVTTWVGGSTAEFNPNPHPVMYYSALHVGSLVLDVDGQRMDVKMIRETGTVDDFFSIAKSIPNDPPTVAITSPAEGATFTAPADIAIAASANDSDGSVTQVDFYGGSTLIGSVTSAPFAVTWNNAAAGSYALTAVATDNLGATVTSAPVNITVLPPPPAAPDSLIATAGNATVSLSWSASGGAQTYTVKRSLSASGPFTTIAPGLAGTGYVDNTVTNGTTYHYVVTASNSGGESSNSNVASATPEGPQGTVPSAPTSLTATALSKTQVRIDWTDTSGDETGFRIERALSDGAFVEVATVGPNTTTFTNNGLKANKTYSYRVRAFNAVGNSTYSNTATVTTPRR
jgi:acid phosphatase type 7